MGFHNDKGRQKQWVAFIRKSRIINVDENFNQIMGRITEFLRAIVISIIDKKRMDKIWDSTLGCWKN